MPRYRPLTERQIQQFQTRDRIIAAVPFYPDTLKGVVIRRQIQDRTGMTFTDCVWAYWVIRLLKQRYLIRRPGAQLCRPRSHEDLVYHVPAFTKRPTRATRRRAQPSLTYDAARHQQIQDANRALVAQLKHYRRPQQTP